MPVASRPASAPSFPACRTENRPGRAACNWTPITPAKFLASPSALRSALHCKPQGPCVGQTATRRWSICTGWSGKRSPTANVSGWPPPAVCPVLCPFTRPSLCHQLELALAPLPAPAAWPRPGAAKPRACPPCGPVRAGSPGRCWLRAPVKTAQNHDSKPLYPTSIVQEPS